MADGDGMLLTVLAGVLLMDILLAIMFLADIVIIVVVIDFSSHLPSISILYLYLSIYLSI